MNLCAQCDTFDQLHNYEVHTIGYANLVNMRNVWMIERCRSSCFLFEAPHLILIRSNRRRQNLKGDVAMKPRVLREINFAHSTLAEQGANLKAVETSRGCE